MRTKQLEQTGTDNTGEQKSSVIKYTAETVLQGRGWLTKAFSRWELVMLLAKDLSATINPARLDLCSPSLPAALKRTAEVTL